MMQMISKLRVPTRLSQSIRGSTFATTNLQERHFSSSSKTPLGNACSKRPLWRHSSDLFPIYSTSSRGGGVSPLFLSFRSLSLTANQRQQTPTEVNLASVPPINDPTTASKEIILDYLPEKPNPLSDPGLVQWVGDPPLEALGLASWWPAGRMQYFMELLHVDIGLPWWGVILTTTVCLRLLVFPLVVKVQRNVARMSNINPELARLQAQITDARKRGDNYDLQKYSHRLNKLNQENNINPLTNIMPILFQLPIFASMFIGLRGMTNLPLESMMTGGLFWFHDLTMADPYYLLPLMLSTSTFLQFKFATEGAGLTTVGPLGKMFLYVFPFILFPITMSFPAAISFYWATTNVISLGQAAVIRSDRVRKILNIPKIEKPKKEDLPAIPKTFSGTIKGFREQIREALDNARVVGDVIDRRILDDENFRKAGSGKPPITYKFDPTITRKKL